MASGLIVKSTRSPKLQYCYRLDVMAPLPMALNQQDQYTQHHVEPCLPLNKICYLYIYVHIHLHYIYIDIYIYFIYIFIHIHSFLRQHTYTCLHVHLHLIRRTAPRIGLMTLGVFFAALFTVAKILGASADRSIDRSGRTRFRRLLGPGERTL